MRQLPTSNFRTGEYLRLKLSGLPLLFAVSPVVGVSLWKDDWSRPKVGHVVSLARREEPMRNTIRDFIVSAEPPILLPTSAGYSVLARCAVLVAALAVIFWRTTATFANPQFWAEDISSFMAPASMDGEASPRLLRDT